jgi:putative peptidoglycan lipid II flippase
LLPVPIEAPGQRSLPTPAPAPGFAPRAEPPSEAGRIARAAGLISLGNVASRILGLLRETVKADYFGAVGAVDAFNVASIVPTMMYDLLIGGMVSSALVPVFSEYLTQGDRDELWRLASALLGLATVIMALFVLIIELAAPQIAYIVSSGSTPETLALTARLLRITAPALVFLGVSGVLSGLLYALKRFAFPAFTAAIFNAAIVLVTLLVGRRWGIGAMAVGLLIGALGQVALQLPGLRDAHLGLGGLRAWRHPGLGRIAALYAPIVLGLAVDTLISRPYSYNLASQTGEGGISWMQYATILIQFPQGLVATATSLAVLPTLAGHAANAANGDDLARFRATLAGGLRLVTVLIVPAAVGLFVLARPVVALLFEHGEFGVHDTLVTAWALRLYLIGLPFAGVDLLLVMAFYARQDTLTPALIGIGTIVIYMLTATLLLPWLGLFSLMVADSFKHLLHAAISGLILRRRLGGLNRHRVGQAVSVALAASAAMGGVTWGVLWLVEGLPAGAWRELTAVAGPGLAGLGVYAALIWASGMDEARLLREALSRRLVR